MSNFARFRRPPRQGIRRRHPDCIGSKLTAANNGSCIACGRFIATRSTGKPWPHVDLNITS